MAANIRLSSKKIYYHHTKLTFPSGTEVYWFAQPDKKYVITDVPDGVIWEYGIREATAAPGKTQHRVLETELLRGGPEYKEGERVMLKGWEKDEREYYVSQSKLDGTNRTWIYDFRNQPTHAIPQFLLKTYREPQYDHSSEVRIGKASIREILSRPRRPRPPPGVYRLKRTVFSLEGDWVYDLQKVGEAGEMLKDVREDDLKRWAV